MLAYDLIMAKKTASHLREHLSVFEAGYPITKGYIARLLIVDSRAVRDVIDEVQTIVQTAEPDKYIHKGSLSASLYHFKKFIKEQKSKLTRAWPSLIDLFLEPFALTFKSLPVASASSQLLPTTPSPTRHPEPTSTLTLDALLQPDTPQTSTLMQPVHSSAPLNLPSSASCGLPSPTNLIVAKRTASHLREHLSVFEAGYPITKGYIARLLIEDSRAVRDVIDEVQTIVQTAEPDKHIQEGTLSVNLYLFNKFLKEKTSQLPRSWPSLIDLFLEPFALTFKSLPVAPVSSQLLQTTPSPTRHLEPTSTPTSEMLIHPNIPVTSALVQPVRNSTSINSPSFPATSKLPSPRKLKRDCASCVNKQRTNMNLSQENKCLSHQLKELRTLFKAEKGNFALKRFNEKIRRKSQSVTFWRDKYTTLMTACKDTQTLLKLVQILEQKVKTLEGKLITAQEENIYMAALNEQLRSMLEKTENDPAHLNQYEHTSHSPEMEIKEELPWETTDNHGSKCALQNEEIKQEHIYEETYDKDEEVDTQEGISLASDLNDIHNDVFSCSPSHSIYTRTDVEVNTSTTVYNSQCSVDVKDEVLSDGTSEHQILNTQNMCNIQDVRSEESKNKQIHKEATESDNVTDYQTMMIADIKDRHNDYSEDLNQGHDISIWDKRMSACEKTPQYQQSDSDIDICSIESLDQILASQKSYQLSILKSDQPSAVQCDQPSVLQFYRCDFCGRGFRQNISLQEHRLIHTGEKPHKCDICGRGYRLNKQLKRHRITHTGEKPYKCNICGYECTHSFSLRIHKCTHVVIKLYKCGVCGRGFKWNSLLQNHMHRHTEEKPYKCDVCGRRFALNSRLQMHTRIHTGEKPYKCDVCDYGFALRINLEAHKRTHTGERPYPCDVCGLAFTQARGLNVHKNTHIGGKPCKCDVCGLEFVEKAELKKHKEIHKWEKNYMCDVCGRRFKTKVHLKSHNRTHTGEKPYQCGFCGKRFSENSGLTKHKRIHTGERPYKCDICSFACTQGHKLKAHKLIHTGEKPYMCNICGFQVNRKDNLKLHQRVHAT